MALTQITYDNKETLNAQPSIANKNKVTSNDMNEIKTVVNGACTQVDTNTTNIGNLTGTILWTNPNPTSSFGNETITLSSDDYDVLEIYYYDYIGTKRVMSERLYKGQNNNLMALFMFNGTFYMGARAVEYTSDTQYLFGNARKIIDQGTVVSGVPTANEWIVPQYIIGYKTGLFN